jgi:hypothetical protein
MDLPHYLDLPNEVKELYRPRFAAAEQAHLRRQASGVHEQQLTGVINETAAALKAPTFANVTAHQIRVLRMGSVLVSPIFMGRGLTTVHAKVGDSINPFMSPLQALHLTLFTVDQKAFNPEFQVEPAEWEARHRTSVKLQPRATTKLPVAYALDNSMRRLELETALNQSTQNMSASDGIDLADRMISQLGI